MIGAGYALETQIPHILFFRVQGWILVWLRIVLMVHHVVLQAGQTLIFFRISEWTFY
jgi:hypothetical protein